MSKSFYFYLQTVRQEIALDIFNIWFQFADFGDQKAKKPVWK